MKWRKKEKKLRIKSSLWSYSCPQCVHNHVYHPTDLCCQWSSSCVSEGLCNGTGLPFPFCHHFSIWSLGLYEANLPVLLATAFWENIWLASELLRYKMAVQKWQFKYIKGFCFVLFCFCICYVSYRGKPLNPELVKAASAVASSLPRNKKQIESELLAQLRRHEETTDKQKKGGAINIGSVYWLFFSIMFEILILPCHPEGDLPSVFERWP